MHIIDRAYCTTVVQFKYSNFEGVLR